MFRNGLFFTTSPRAARQQGRHSRPEPGRQRKVFPRGVRTAELGLVPFVYDRLFSMHRHRRSFFMPVYFRVPPHGSRENVHRISVHRKFASPTTRWTALSARLRLLLPRRLRALRSELPPVANALPGCRCEMNRTPCPSDRFAELLASGAVHCFECPKVLQPVAHPPISATLRMNV